MTSRIGRDEALRALDEIAGWFAKLDFRQPRATNALETLRSHLSAVQGKPVGYIPKNKLREIDLSGRAITQISKYHNPVFIGTEEATPLYAIPPDHMAVIREAKKALKDYLLAERRQYDEPNWQKFKSRNAASAEVALASIAKLTGELT